MTLQIGFLLFPKVQQLDLTAPYEVFASLPDTTMHLVWKNADPVTSATGLRLTPTSTFASCPPLDILCVPGGQGIDALLDDAPTLDFIRRQAGNARYLASVCTGALVLGAAGLLRGRRATTHWASHEFLSAFGAIPVQARVVQDGALITGGGVTAGIDMALTLAAELFDRTTAESVQLHLEYAPAPPFSAGHPDSAPAEALRRAQERAAPALAARREAVLRISRKMAASGGKTA